MASQMLNEPSDQPSAEDLGFYVKLAAVECILWWLLLLAAAAFACLRHTAASSTWCYYFAAAALAALKATSASAAADTDASGGYNVQHVLVFSVCSGLATSVQMALLIAAAGGYRITRSKLEPRTVVALVVLPTLALVSGLVYPMARAFSVDGASPSSPDDSGGSEGGDPWSIAHEASQCVTYIYVLLSLFLETRAMQRHFQVHQTLLVVEPKNPVLLQAQSRMLKGLFALPLVPLFYMLGGYIEADYVYPAAVFVFLALGIYSSLVLLASTCQAERVRGLSVRRDAFAAYLLGGGGQPELGEFLLQHGTGGHEHDNAKVRSYNLLSALTCLVASYCYSVLTVLFLLGFADPSDEVTQKIITVSLRICQLVLVFVLLVLTRPQTRLDPHYLTLDHGDERPPEPVAVHLAQLEQHLQAVEAPPVPLLQQPAAAPAGAVAVAA